MPQTRTKQITPDNVARTARPRPAWSRLCKACLVCGLAFSALAVATLLGLLWFFSKVEDTSTLETSITVPGAFLLSEQQSDIVSQLIAAPGVLLLFATTLLFFFVLLRQGTTIGVENRGSGKGGTVTSQLKPLETRYHLAWIAVAVIAWLALIVLPLLLAAGGGWPVSLDETQESFTFLTLGAYGGLSAALAVMMSVSLAKKTAYRAAILRRGDRALSGGAGKSFWRWFTFRWRFDLWLADDMRVGLALAAGTPVQVDVGCQPRGWPIHS